MDKTSEQTGAYFVAEALSRHGITTAFVYPGGTIAPVLDLLDGCGIAAVCARHEQGAGYAALAAARILERPQVVIVSSGPGVTNVVTAIADAYFDGVPLLVITGQVGTGDMRGDRPVRQRGFQEVDTPALMAPITKAQFQPSTPDAVAGMMEDAFRIAAEGRPGPVLIDMPMDVQRGKISGAADKRRATSEPTRPTPSDAAVAQAADLLAGAERPLILAGHGSLAEGAYKHLRAIAEAGNIPVTMSLHALGAIPTDHRLALGFHGHTGNQVAGLAIQNCDVLLVVGSRLDLRQTGSKTDQFAPQARIVRIELDEGELSHPRVRAGLDLHGAAAPTLERIQRALAGRQFKDHTAWLDQIAKWRKEHRLEFAAGDPLKPQAVVAAVNRATAGRDLVCVSGVGSHQQWTARHFDFDYPRRLWLTSGGHGAMGFDLPVAMGAQRIRPDTLVVCMVGDGSIQMNIQELATIVSFCLPVKIVVMDNRRLAIVSQFQMLNWNRDPTCGDKWNPDFAAIARAYGLWGETVKAAADLDGAVGRLLDHDGPGLLHCLVDPGEDISPMLLAGQSLDKMWVQE